MNREELKKLAERKVELLGDTLKWAGSDRAVACPYDFVACTINCAHCDIVDRRIFCPSGELVSTGLFFIILLCGGPERTIEIEVDPEKDA